MPNLRDVHVCCSLLGVRWMCVGSNEYAQYIAGDQAVDNVWQEILQNVDWDVCTVHSVLSSEVSLPKGIHGIVLYGFEFILIVLIDHSFFTFIVPRCYVLVVCLP